MKSISLCLCHDLFLGGAGNRPRFTGSYAMARVAAGKSAVSRSLTFTAGGEMALVVGPAGGALSVATEVLLFDIAKLGGLPRSAEHAAASLLACPTALLGHLLVTGPALKTLRLAPGLQVGILAGYEGFFGELPPDSRVALVNYAQLPASLVLEHEVLQAA